MDAVEAAARFVGSVSNTVSSDDAFGAVRHGYAPSAPSSDRQVTAVPTGVQDGGLPPVKASLHDLVQQGKATMRAEADVLRQRVALAGNGGRSAAASGGIAALFALLALIALTIGLLLLAMEYLGPVLGLVVVVGVLLVLTAIFAFRVKSGVQTVRTAFSADGTEPS